MWIKLRGKCDKEAVNIVLKWLLPRKQLLSAGSWMGKSLKRACSNWEKTQGSRMGYL